MHRLDEHVIEEIRARVDIVEVISDYVPLRRAGKNFVGLCPFHQERTPSFTVSPDKQMFYCFGCQTGGDVFTFLMKREGWSFPEAVAELARRAGVVLPER
ncbi:MAG TPA: CHC2 zinc finger domain-containing protein, partial [Thermaerobacter sp.]